MGTTDDRRPNPDDLLRGVRHLEQKTKRGALRVFFGMCPGVGKTFAMLKASHERKLAGVDVVVGVVETHGRFETAQLLENLELIPKKQLEYRGTDLEEMDLDAILKRRPQLVLVDELAHTNAPGSRHTKRFQDVEELIAAGIDVYTTLNVQHIESRADLVYQITSIPVLEKVPDSFLDLADQMELIDLSPEVLLRRLSDGKVYLGERADRAAENFFKLENIIALRELALRFTAEKVDDQLRTQMVLGQVRSVWNTNERLMVAVSYSPFSARLVRATRRIAHNLEAPWIALYVDLGDNLSEDDERQLRKNLELAKELGAEVVHTRDQSIAPALTRVAHEKNVTQIVLGRPDRRLVRDFLQQGTLLDQLVRETSEIDIHVIRQERKPKYKGLQLALPKLRTGFFPYWYTLWTLIAVALASYAALPWIGYRSIGFIFLSAVLGLATIASRGPIFFSATFSALVWNYFFIPPQFTFTIKEPEDVMNFAALFIVAAVAGLLTSRIKRQEGDLSERAQRSAILYEFTRALSHQKDSKQIADFALESIKRVFGFEAAILRRLENGQLSDTPEHRVSQKVDPKDYAVAAWAFHHSKRAGQGTSTLNSAACLAVPLAGRSGTVGILLLWQKPAQRLTLEQETLLDTFASNLAISLEREMFEQRAKEAEILENSEKLHQALLSSVSHELRTPLTAIMGNASALKDPALSAHEDVRSSLIDDLIASSERLNRTVENLLDMTRISAGALKVRKEIFEINDFIASTLQRSVSLTRNHRVIFQPVRDDRLVQADDRLLEHVLINLLANAVVYSPQGSKIEIAVFGARDQVCVSISDEGFGIPHEHLTRVFDRFFRVQGSPTGGTGLGLSIARALTEAQGGTIVAANRSERRGCIFTLSFPEVQLQAGARDLLT